VKASLGRHGEFRMLLAENGRFFEGAGPEFRTLFDLRLAFTRASQPAYRWVRQGRTRGLRTRVPTPIVGSILAVTHGLPHGEPSSAPRWPCLERMPRPISAVKGRPCA
jgi:hypothetical protein